MSYQLLSESEPRARKNHTCVWCGEVIPKGTCYRHEKSVYDGSFQNHHWHFGCNEAANDYFRESHSEDFDLYNNERPGAVYHDMIRGKDIRFNDVVKGFSTGITGRLVQVRLGCGQFGSDLYFIRLKDGGLMTVENEWIAPDDEAVVPVGPDDIGNEYTIRGEWPEVGFVIEKPKQPETPGSFSMMITKG